jgi:SAM-dependent methyltransferase
MIETEREISPQMNTIHHWLCRSNFWRDTTQKRLPWVIQGVPLGQDVLEIGPGFGVTTDLILPAVKHLTCVEIDRWLARKLAGRLSGKNVSVLCENASDLSLRDCSFDAVLCFTMLHHVPSPIEQDRVFKEAARVLRSGGIFAGTDSVYSWRFHLLHIFDTMVVVSPETLPERLRSAGFADVEVETNASAFRFRARKPAVGEQQGEVVQCTR